MRTCVAYRPVILKFQGIQVSVVLSRQLRRAVKICAADIRQNRHIFTSHAFRSSKTLSIQVVENVVCVF